MLQFDANDYRALRIEELRLSALTAAEKVKKSHLPFHFNPMNSRERRIIHLALRDEPTVRSESAGHGSEPAGRGVPGRHEIAAVQPRAVPAARPPIIAAFRHDRRHLHTRSASRYRCRSPLRTRKRAASRSRSSASPEITSGSRGRRRLGALVDEQGATVDQVVATFFAAPRSYTAEDVIEISCHGAPVVLRYCVERAVRAGARLAEPGEFTLRAYLNGRIDLPQAEAVRDLIEATTLYQARVAAQQVEGSVSRRIAPLKEQLLELISLLEAGIDFAEDDIDVASDEEILRRLAPIEEGLERLARTFAYGKLVHDGFTLAIVGRPNVGKSSLFNRLLEQDRAIVTEIPGTTRDTVSETASLNGIPVRFIDTAGIRAGEDRVEQLGIERSYQAMADADLTLVVLDASEPLTPMTRR